MDKNGANLVPCLKAATGGVLIKKVSLKMSQYSQKITCVRAFL